MKININKKMIPILLTGTLTLTGCSIEKSANELSTLDEIIYGMPLDGFTTEDEKRVISEYSSSFLEQKYKDISSQFIEDYCNGLENSSYEKIIQSDSSVRKLYQLYFDAIDSKNSDKMEELNAFIHDEIENSSEETMLLAMPIIRSFEKNYSSDGNQDDFLEDLAVMDFAIDRIQKKAKNYNYDELIEDYLDGRTCSSYEQELLLDPIFLDIYYQFLEARDTHNKDAIQNLYVQLQEYIRNAKNYELVRAYPILNASSELFDFENVNIDEDILFKKHSSKQ